MVHKTPMFCYQVLPLDGDLIGTDQRDTETAEDTATPVIVAVSTRKKHTCSQHSRLPSVAFQQETEHDDMQKLYVWDSYEVKREAPGRRMRDKAHSIR